MNNLGPIGEKIARHYLEERGYVFVDANFKTRHGEIDIIMMDKDEMVFVEVKTRRDGNQSSGNEELPESKLNAMEIAINEYLELNGGEEWRAELVAVTVYKNGMVKVKLINI